MTPSALQTRVISLTLNGERIDASLEANGLNKRDVVKKPIL